MRTPQKIALIFIFICSTLWGVYQYWLATQRANILWHEIPPRRLNLLGINNPKKFKFILANRAIKLEYLKESSSKSVNKYVPLIHLLDSLKGKPESISMIFQFLEGYHQSDFPIDGQTWKLDDLRKKIDSDPNFISKIKNEFSLAIPLTIQLSEKKMVQTTALIPFSEAQINARSFKKKLLKKVSKENIQSYENKISSFLQNFTVIFNESHVNTADTILSNNLQSKKTYSLRVHLSPQGVKRLFEYKALNCDGNGLLLFDGVGIVRVKLDSNLYSDDLLFTEIHSRRILDKITGLFCDKENKN